eukprot:gene2981-1963_t
MYYSNLWVVGDLLLTLDFDYRGLTAWIINQMLRFYFPDSNRLATRLTHWAGHNVTDAHTEITVCGLGLQCGVLLICKIHVIVMFYVGLWFVTWCLGCRVRVIVSFIVVVFEVLLFAWVGIVCIGLCADELCFKLKSGFSGLIVVIVPLVGVPEVVLCRSDFTLGWDAWFQSCDFVGLLVLILPVGGLRVGLRFDAFCGVCMLGNLCCAGPLGGSLWHKLVGFYVALPGCDFVDAQRGTYK